MYALRLRSDGYRLSLADEVSKWMGMRITIGQVQPRSWDRRSFGDIEAFLPMTGEKIFTSRSATWIENQNSGETGSTLKLKDGWLLVGTSRWSASDYQQMLEGGLAHDYRKLGLSEVHIENLDLRFVHPPLEFRAGATTGVIIFDDSGDGRASLNCARLNGLEVSEPVNIVSRFTPGEYLTFHEVRLTVPEMPLASLGLDDLLGSRPASGTFEGTITYKPTKRCEQITVSGAVREARLADLTRMVAGGPFEGVVDIVVDSACFRDGKLTNLTLHNSLEGLPLSDIIPDLADGSPLATLKLQVDRLVWTEGKLAYLSTRGKCENVPLESLSRLVGKGEITGSARLNIRSLLIVDDELRFADLDLIADPHAGAPGTIDRALLAQLAQRFLGVDLSAVLPEQVEYLRLGVNLVVDRGMLKLYGTHGHQNRTILTVDVAGHPFPLLTEPEQSFDVSNLLGKAQGYVTKLDLDTLREWWHRQHREAD